MRTYLDQPKEITTEDTPLHMRMEKIQSIIKEVVEEELPECDTNNWFVESVYCANMLDKIMEKIWMNV